MAKTNTEKIMEFNALDNRLISVVEDQGFLCHLEFCPTISTLHYIDSTFQLQRAGMPTSFVGLIQQNM